MTIFNCIGFFAIGFITDTVWALYIHYAAEQNRLKSALYSVGTGICTVLFLEGFLMSWLNSIPWLVGLFFGTYFAPSIEKIFKHEH